MAKLAHDGSLNGTILDNRLAIFGSTGERPQTIVFYVDIRKQHFLAVVHAPQPEGR
jgi:hypothetical protein